MGISPYIARVRERIGTDLLLLPSVAVLPRDTRGAVLLVRQADSGRWGTIGGCVEPDEDPATAAVREAEEEAGVVVALGQVLGVLGGPEYRVRYPNGDETAYVTIAYEAEVTGGELRPDGDEITEVRWFAPGELAAADLTPFARSTFTALGLLGRD